MKSIGAMKAPGPDGLTALFYHTYWDIVKEDVVKSVQHFFSTGFLLKEMNHTHIVLIPKRPNPTMVTHYRPISLCTVHYKIIARLLASRLRTLLNKVISPMQAGFVPGRLIQENSLLMHEILHTMKK